MGFFGSIFDSLDRAGAVVLGGRPSRVAADLFSGNSAANQYGTNLYESGRDLAAGVVDIGVGSVDFVAEPIIGAKPSLVLPDFFNPGSASSQFAPNFFEEQERVVSTAGRVLSGSGLPSVLSAVSTPLIAVAVIMGVFAFFPLIRSGSTVAGKAVEGVA